MSPTYVEKTENQGWGEERDRGATGLGDRKREGLCPLSDRERVTECEKVNKLEGGQCHLAGKTAIISAI